MITGRGSQEWFLDYSSNIAPRLVADESHTLAEYLAHEVSRVVVHGFDMLVRVSENCFELFAVGENAASRMILALLRPST